ncbi:hypothetical protein [Novosphingobium sp. Leaf2]|uniref:hypothetical protein n=1 Tax=Novosphingobium sp. Leaf2 TaxID=1735670 RepID=UPI0006FE5F34|nr:hypothetical protein [Novosphingobium sp. Leaf2]KQM21788.1 hypothetical protein ASE49_00215 [Novosphingobium sp. Leaf2]
MLERADPILKLCLALAVLLAGAGIGYYYGIYLPTQDVRRQRLEMTAKQDREAQQALALARRVQREQAAQADYAQCMGLAESGYRQRWTQACQSMHDADQSAFEDCADDLFSTRSGCLAKHPIRPAQDCALPAQAARSLSDARDQRRAQCTAQLETAQRARS